MIIGTAAAVFALDTASKIFAKRKLKEHEVKSVVEGRVNICHETNKGFACGMGDKKPEYVVAVSAGCVSFLAGKAALMSRKRKRGLSGLAAGMVIGGGLSNVKDRLEQGAVTDYINVQAGPKKVRKAAFNLGDVALLGGTALWVCLDAVHGLKKKK